jgi:winged helix-turn helix protein
MKPMVVTAEQRKEMQRRRKKTLDRWLYERLTAVLTVASGCSPEEVAHLLGADLAQLNHWLAVFANDGLEALCTLSEDAPSPCND